MNRKKATKLAAIVIIFQLSFAGMCGSGSPDKARTLAKATDDFAEGQKSAATLLLTAKSDGSMTQEQIDEIKPFLQQANALNDQAIALGKQFLANPTDQNVKQQLITTINQVSATLVRANNAGLTHIKNAKTQLAFSALITTMQAAATTAVALLVKEK